MSSERRLLRLRLSYAGDIEQAALYRLNGLNPMLLRENGRDEEATMLSFIHSRLDGQGLMQFVDKRVEELKQESLDKPTPKTQTRSPKKSYKPRFNQTLPPFPEIRGAPISFDPVDQTGQQWGFKPMTHEMSLVIKDLIHDPEAAIVRMFRINESRKRKDRQEFYREFARDFAREWRALLKKWGIPTWGEKRKELSRKMHQFIKAYQILGIWELMMSNLSADLIEELRPILSQSRRRVIDKYSSDDVRFFASELAYALQQAEDLDYEY